MDNNDNYVADYIDPDDQDLSCQIHDDDGVVHYYDDEGVEVETFIPDWGC